MLQEQKPTGQLRIKKLRSCAPLTLEELDFLYKKRFINEGELLRLLSISPSTMYDLIRKGELVPCWLGSKKMFDIEELYHQLEQSRRRGRLKKSQT